MFRRRWSGLPVYRQFPADLKKLGYFVNADDEVRSLEDDRFYFKYYLSKNDRVNVAQRFAFNTAIEAEVHSRIEALGFEKVLLPLGTADIGQPHIPIFASRGINTKKHVIVVFGEPCQDLGILALRVMNGPGGVNKGSVVSVINYLLDKDASRKTKPNNDGEDTPKPDAITDDDDVKGIEDADTVGIVLANTGQTYWWPEGKRALGPQSRLGVPLPSAVHYGCAYDYVPNIVLGNEDPTQHVAYVFDHALPALLRGDAMVGVIAISEGAHAVHDCLDKPERWSAWEGRLGALASLGGCYDAASLNTAAFKEFLVKRARAYVWSDTPKGTLISGPQGNPKTRTTTSYGCPVFSSGENALDELIFIAAKEMILDWVTEALRAPDGYVNPQEIAFPSPNDLPCDENESTGGSEGKEGGWDWAQVPDDAKPSVSWYNHEELQKQIEEAERWEQFNRTGIYPAPGVDPDDDYAT